MRDDRETTLVNRPRIPDGQSPVRGKEESLRTLLIQAVVIAAAWAAWPAAAVTLEQLTQATHATITSVTLVEDVTPTGNIATVLLDPVPPQCLFGSINYDPRTDMGKAIHGSILAAKAAGTRVTIGYQRIVSGYVVDCRLRTLQLE